MKDCEKREGFVAFDSLDEFETWFKKITGLQELTDVLTVEGNSGLMLGDVKNWINYFGIGNVYFEKSSHGFFDEFWFDIKNAVHIGDAHFDDADEISMSDGFLRIWFD